MYQKFITHEKLTEIDQLEKLLVEIRKEYSATLITQRYETCSFYPGYKSLTNQNLFVNIITRRGGDDLGDHIIGADLAVFMPDEGGKSHPFRKSKLITMALRTDVDFFGEEIEKLINSTLDEIE